MPRPLTEKEKMVIWLKINDGKWDDDRDPEEVIKEDFQGNEEAYLRRMAEWHQVPLGQEG